MKTEDILNLDCEIEENQIKVNSFLYKIKPIKRLSIFGIVPLAILEEVRHKLSIKYGYATQGVKEYYEGGRFVFYTASVITTGKQRDWLGNVYGKSYWEIEAKLIIKIYADIKRRQGEGEQCEATK